MRRISSRIVLGLALCPVLVLLAVAPVSGQQPTNPPPTPQRIGYGQSASGELSIQRPEVLYIFTAQQADAILVTMDALEGESTLDPLVILVDQSQQNVLAVDNDSGGNHNARLRYVIPAAGTYIIRATTVQGTGDIRGRFTLSLTLGNPTPTPSPTSGAPMIAAVEPGDTVHGDLDDSTPFHLYAVRARQGEPIVAGITVTPQGFQTGIYLYGADFKEIGRAELGAALNVNAPADGLYFVMVARAATSGAGAFTLRYGNTAGTTGITISTGQTVRGTINAGSAVKTYSLSGKAGQAIAVRMRRLSGDLAVYVYVVAIDSGKTLAQATAGSGLSGEAELTTTLPADGTYAVIATREGQQSGTTTGDYMLSVVPPGQTSAVPATMRNYTPIKYGDKVSSTIDEKTYAVPYVFSASAGDVIQVTMSMVNGDLDPYVILQNANGDTVGEDDDSGVHPNARLQVTIPEAGYYGLIATRADLGNGTTTGQFALSLNVVDAALPTASTAREGALLVPGQAQAGAIGPQLASLFRFEAQANMSVGINVNTAGGLEVVTLLADSNFQEVTRATTGSIRPTLLPRAGTYFVLVARRGGPIDPSFGAFSVTLQGGVNSPTQQASNNSTSNVLTFGQAVTGTITKEAYQVRYTIGAKQGTTLLVTMDAAPDSALNPMVAVLDAEGKLLILNDDTAQGIKNAALIYDVLSDGRYIILATRSGESTGTTTGAYTLKVEVRQPDPSAPSAASTVGATVPPTIPPTADAAVTSTPPATDAGGSQTTAIRYGETLNGSITAQKFLNYYNFQGTAGEVITIGMTRAPDSQLDSLLYLYTYEGQPQLIAANNDLVAGSPDAAIVRFKLPQSGRYLIVATRVGAAQGNTEGNYTLTLSRDE